MNCLAETKDDLIRRFAYNFWQIRERCHLQGSAEQDYRDAEEAYESYAKIHNGLDRWKE